MHPIAVQMRSTPSVFPSEGAFAAMIARGSTVTFVAIVVLVLSWTHLKEIFEDSGVGLRGSG